MPALERSLTADPVAEGVFALGGVERSDGRISFAAAEGWLPLSSYLIVCDDEGLFVDSGVAAHERLVLAQAAAAAPQLTRATIAITRSVEFDAIGNAVALVHRFPVDTLVCHYADAEPVRQEPSVGVDYLRVGPSFELPPGARDESGLRCLLAHETETLSVDRGGTRVVDVISAPLRLLSTAWYFDRTTGVLFTSDAFGHALLDAPDAPRVVDRTGEVGADAARLGLSGKFDWLQRADVAATIDRVTAVFDAYPVETIAPGFGRVLRGRAVVEEQVGLVLDAIAATGGGR